MTAPEIFQNGKDGSWCPVRTGGLIFACLSSLAYFGLAAWTVIVLKTPFDYGGFGGGLAAVWGVVGVAIAAKAKVEK